MNEEIETREPLTVYDKMSAKAAAKIKRSVSRDLQSLIRHIDIACDPCMCRGCRAIRRRDQFDLKVFREQRSSAEQFVEPTSGALRSRFGKGGKYHVVN
jgi:hypothetical protein